MSLSGSKLIWGGGASAIIGNIYRPTNNLQININNAIDYHCAILDQIKSDPEFKKCKLYLVGDYNLDLIKYDENSNVCSYVDNMYNYGLFPVVTKPTRIADINARCPIPSATLLDHIFTDSYSSKYAGIIINGISDHFPIFLIDEVKKKP